MMITQRTERRDFKRHFQVTAITDDGIPAFTLAFPFPEGKNEHSELDGADRALLRAMAEHQVAAEKWDEWLFVDWLDSVTMIVAEND